MTFPLFLLIFFFPLGQLGRFQIPGSEIVIQANDLLVLFFVLSTIIFRFSTLLEALKKDSLTKPVFLWILIMLFSLLLNVGNFSFYQLSVSSLYAFRWIIYSAIYFCLKSYPFNHRKLLFSWLILDILIIAILGLAQFTLVPDVSYLKAWHWDDHYYRVVSTFLDPGFTGIILGFGLLSLFLLTFTRFSLKTFLPMSVVYIAFSLTYSRASYVFYLSALAITSILRKSPIIIIIATITLFLTIQLLPKTFGEGTKLHRENSVLARIENWRTSLEIWTKSPIFGHGFNTYRYVQIKSTSPTSLEIINSHSAGGADSSLLLVLSTTGLIGLFIYLFLLLKIILIHRRHVFIVSFLGGLTLHSFFNNTLFYPFVMELMWLSLSSSEIIQSFSTKTQI